MYSDEEGFEIFAATCCGQPMSDTGCDAVSCRGYACEECGSGCDREASENGQCARELAAESEEDRAARFDRERAVFGLPPVSAYEEK